MTTAPPIHAPRSMTGPINDAQRRLYDRLLRSLEDEVDPTTVSEDSETAALSKEEAEIELKRQQQLRSQERTRIRLERRAEYLRRKREEERNKVEGRKRAVREEKERKRRTTLTNHLKEKIRKTHDLVAGAGTLNIVEKTTRHFTGNSIVLYFGETIQSGGGWIPHGKGRILNADGEVCYDGGFHKGNMHGRGTFRFDNGDYWFDGQFRMDELNGIGVWISGSRDPTRRYRRKRDRDWQKEGHDNIQSIMQGRDSIYHGNCRVCFTDEITPGVHIQRWTEVGAARGRTSRGGAIVLGPDKKRGHFLVKSDEDGTVQVANLVEERFRIDRTTVSVIPLENILPKVATEKEGHTRPRITPPPVFDCRDFFPSMTTSYKENFYSSDATENPEEEKEKLMSETHRRQKIEQELLRNRLQGEQLQSFIEEELELERVARHEAEMAAMKDAALHEEKLKRRKEELVDRRITEQAKIDKSRRDALALCW